MNIGRSKFSPGGELRFGYYHPEPGDTVLRVAMFVINTNGTREYVATVNCEGSPPEPGFVYLRGSSDCDGVPEAFVAAGVVELVRGGARPTGYTHAYKAKLTQAALDELARQNPPRPM